jgi:hypothetical protein
MFIASPTAEMRDLLGGLDSPARIQAFLDDIPYSGEEVYRCPLRVLQDRQAHCADGALFAAAALRQLGHPPLIVDLLAERDDEHLLAAYRQDGHWGAIAKSNFVGLRYREPVYRSLRELVMSYFEVYFNVACEKTLRGYTQPLNLSPFDRCNWMTSDEHLEAIMHRLDRVRRFYILTPAMRANLSRVDERSCQAGMLGVNAAGLYQLPEKGG